MAYKDNAQASINRNNLKLTADKVIQILDQVREEGKKSRRRWIWELMQNAKDVPNQYGRVSILIELSNDQLKFRHNGDPFRIENITGIIQQVSTKPSNSGNGDTTGKFGTGFIATHLLSDKVTISGVVQEQQEEAKRFEFELDRSGKSSEELMKPIEDALNLIHQIDDDTKFPPVKNYLVTRKESDLDNCFSYPLTNPDSLNAAKEGVGDLKVTLPLTLAFLHKIKQVRVVNKIANEDLTYACEADRGKEGFSIAVINIHNNISSKSQHEYYIIYSDGETTLAAQVSDLTSNELKVKNDHQPFLYRDFPLIGTENFHFPFILNSKRLYPTEKRDGILLNGSLEKPTSNRKALINASQCAIKLVDALIELDAKNLFITALSRLPHFEFEDDCKQWYIQKIQQPYRKAITTKKIVESPLPQNLTLEEAAFPKSVTNELHEAFWEICSPFLNRAVPQKEHLNNWHYYIGPENESNTWEYELYYELNNLLKEIEERQDISNVSLTGDEPLSTLTWLSNVYKFVLARKESELLNQYAVVPNQYGKLKTLDSLFIEHPGKHIPDELLDVLKELGKDWRDEIINRKINLPIESHQTRDVSLISTTINEILTEEKKGTVKERLFLKKSNALSILIAILRINSRESIMNSFRHKLFKFAKELFHFEDDFIQVDNIAQFKFEPAIRLMITIVNEEISKSSNLNALSLLLHCTEEQATIWLDQYLRLLQGNSEYKHFLEEGNIVPNRKNELGAYKDLFNYGTEDQPLDGSLLTILKEFDETKDWNPILIADGIGIKLPNTKTFEQLGKVIQELIIGIKGEDSYESHSKPILHLINWVSINTQLASSYLPGFTNLKTEFFFKVTVGKDQAANDHIFKILRNKENLAILAELSSNGTDLTALKRLSAISKEVGFAPILKEAEALLKEKEEFNFKREVGHTVEALLEDLFSTDLPNYEVKFIGTGPYDFIVSNKTNGNEYYVELKSVNASNTEPIKMAISQARYAAKYPDRYVLCFIRRPDGILELSKKYLRENIKCIYQVGSDVKRAVDESNNVDNYIKASNAIKLEIKDPEMKVSFDLEYVEKLGKNFDSLRENIILRLSD